MTKVDAETNMDNECNNWLVERKQNISFSKLSHKKPHLIPLDVVQKNKNDAKNPLITRNSNHYFMQCTTILKFGLTNYPTRNVSVNDTANINIRGIGMNKKSETNLKKKIEMECKKTTFFLKSRLLAKSFSEINNLKKESHEPKKSFNYLLSTLKNKIMRGRSTNAYYNNRTMIIGSSPVKLLRNSELIYSRASFKNNITPKSILKSTMEHQVIEKPQKIFSDELLIESLGIKKNPNFYKKGLLKLNNCYQLLQNKGIY